MKKVLMCVAVVTLLAGCGSGSKGPESKTCTVTEAGMPMEIKMNAVDNEIESMNMSVTVEEDFSTLTAEQKTMIESTLLDQFNIGDDAKGVKASVEFSDASAVIKVDLNLKEADKEVLKTFELDSFFTDLKLDSNVKYFESDGATCK